MLRSKRGFLIAATGIFAMFSGIYFSLQRSTNQSQHKTLWKTQLYTMTGETYELKRFQGKPLLLNFWASWCPPCVEEMPLLDVFYQQNTSKNFQLLGIATDKLDAIQRFLAKTPVRFPIAVAGFDGIALSQSLGNTTGGLPFTVLLDKNSAVLFTKSGQLTTNDISNITNLISTPDR